MKGILSLVGCAPLLLETSSLSADFRNEEVDKVSYGPDSFGDILSTNRTDITFLRGSFSSLERIVLTANGNLQRILSAYYGSPISVEIPLCQLLSTSSTKAPTNSSKDSSHGDLSSVSIRSYSREAHLLVCGKVVCVARGQIDLFSSECVEAIEGKNIGIGQLFRYLGVLPTFTLLAVGRDNSTDLIGGSASSWEQLDSIYSADSSSYSLPSPLPSFSPSPSSSSLYREYELECPQMKCRFTEIFRPGFLDLVAV
eukprot:gene29151-38214_t